LQIALVEVCQKRTIDALAPDLLRDAARRDLVEALPGIEEDVFASADDRIWGKQALVLRNAVDLEDVRCAPAT
jgi:hypothetical protein